MILDFGCLRCGKRGIDQVPTHQETVDDVVWQHFDCTCIHCGHESHHATVVSFEAIANIEDVEVK